MIYNLSKKKTLSTNTKYADTFFVRAIGMMFKDFDKCDAMVFENCNAVQTFFMKINIDIVFIDNNNKVTSLYPSTPAWKAMIRDKQAYSVIEFPEQTIDKTTIQVGDTLSINTEVFDKDTTDINSNNILDCTTETVASCSKNRGE